MLQTRLYPHILTAATQVRVCCKSLPSGHLAWLLAVLKALDVRFPRRSETRASQRSRSSKNNPLRSFRSEPAYKPLEGGKGSERVSLSPRRRHSHLFSDYPSDTRRRIDKSLSVLRDLRNATSPLDYSYHSRDDDLMGSSIFRERQENIERKMVQDLDERYREVIDSLNARITASIQLTLLFTSPNHSLVTCSDTRGRSA